VNLLVRHVLSFALAASPALDDGERLMRALRYGEALKPLEAVRSDPNAPRVDRDRALELLIRSYAALGQREAAELAAVELLREVPSYAISADGSPKLREIVDAARQRAYPKGTAVLRQLPGGAQRVTLELIDAWGEVASIEWVEHSASGEVSRSLPATPRVELELRSATSGWSALAKTADGRVLARLDRPNGSLAAAALAPTPPAPTVAPAWSRWTLLSASAAALVAGAGMRIASASDIAQARTTAPGEPGHFASDAQLLQERARARAIWGDVLLGGGLLGGAVTTWVWLRF
jgi:hypothetical protein